MADITKIDKKGNIIASFPMSLVGNYKGICYIGAGYFAIIFTRGRDLSLYSIRIDWTDATGRIDNIKLIKAFSEPGVAPTSYPHGVCTDGMFFYVICQETTIPQSGRVFKIDMNGNTQEIYHISGASHLRFRGITFNGKYFFATEIKENELWQFDQEFNLIKKVSLPENLNRGACFDGVNLWVGGATNDDLYCLDYQGNVKNQISPSAGNLVGVATDGKDFYITQ